MKKIFTSNNKRSRIQYLWGWRSLNRTDWKSELLYNIINNNNSNSKDVLVVFPFIPKIYSILGKIFGPTLLVKIIKFTLSIFSLKYRIILASYENQDQGPFAFFGLLCRQCDYLVISHWPAHYTKTGIQFPYWYNIINWHGYEKTSQQHKLRFGRAIDINELLSPQLPDNWRYRTDAAVIVASHARFPRYQNIEEISRRITVEKYGKIGTSFSSNKLDLLKEYKYAIYDENTLGYGYVTEKLPEIIAAGNVPLTIGMPPESLFEPINVMHCGKMHKLYKLSQKPSMTAIESSIRMYLR
jgi:hypothetical protein